MPRLKYDVPKYRKHNGNYAIVSIRGTRHCLGLYDSPESRARYDELIAQYLTRRDHRDAGLTVSQLMAHYWRYCKQRYGKHGKGRFGAAINYRPILRLLRSLYGATLATKFGPLALQEVRRAMIEKGAARTYINDQISRGVQAFKWGASQELIPHEVYQRLTSVEGLRIGQSDAAETDPVEPIADDVVDATLPQMPTHIAAMVQLQRLTGMRPGEICVMRGGDVDRESWTYKPVHHKTRHHGKSRVIVIGPKAQAVMAPFLLKAGDGHLFVTRRRRHYETDTYRRAIHRACDKAGLPRWSPNRLRHTAATAIVDEYGLEHAKAVLGHSQAAMTEHYSRTAKAKAEEVARGSG
jgi:integrase